MTISPEDNPELTSTEARAGTTNHVVRYVLGISLGLAIVAMIVIYVIG